jgi:hypothetical protein
MNKTQHTVALLLILMITPCLTWAQKKELSQARTYIKSGKDYDKAERLMTNLLANPKNKDNKKIYLMWYEAVRGQYDQANERLYLNQKQDTAAFFNLNHRMFTILEALDSIDMRPNDKGKTDPEYRTKHAELLHAYRPNLFNAGSYHLRKGNYQEAFNFFEAYIDCEWQPLFTNYDYKANDKRLPEAGYWATFAAYKMKDPVLTLRHRELALRDSSKANFTLQYIAEARRWLNDKELYLQSLEEGFSRYPTFSYFFPRLMDAYIQEEELDKALATANKALEVCDTCDIYLFAKSTTLLKMERYEESINVSRQLIERNSNMAEAYFNTGTAYLNLALPLNTRQDKKKMQQLCQQALPYMEQYRIMMPGEKAKWGPALYRIYLNLNMGKKFDEIDQILKE